MSPVQPPVQSHKCPHQHKHTRGLAAGMEGTGQNFLLQQCKVMQMLKMQVQLWDHCESAVEGAWCCLYYENQKKLEEVTQKTELKGSPHIPIPNCWDRLNRFELLWNCTLNHWTAALARAANPLYHFCKIKWWQLSVQTCINLQAPYTLDYSACQKTVVCQVG